MILLVTVETLAILKEIYDNVNREITLMVSLLIGRLNKHIFFYGLSEMLCYLISLLAAQFRLKFKTNLL